MTDVRHTTAWATARAAWQQQINLGLVDCWRCSLPIAPEQPWDLGHPTDRPHHAAPTDVTVIAHCRPEHRRCNGRAGPRERRAVTETRSIARDDGQLW